MEFLDIFILVFRIYFYITISLLPLYLYKTFFKSKYKPNSDFYYKREWYHFLKVLWSQSAVNRYKKSFSKVIKQETNEALEPPRKLTTFMRSDSQTIYGVDQKGNSLFLKITLREKRLAELCMQLRFSDGSVYQLPEHPLILLCSIPTRKWEAGGLEILVVEPFQTLKITYNGLLRNYIRNDGKEDTNGQVKHCYFSFIWSAACGAKFFPQDLTTNELANAVAVEPWKNAKWIKLLGYETGYGQYGMLHGQVSLDKEAAPLVLRLTSYRKRTWGPSKVRILHRALTLFAADKQGRSFTLNVKSYIHGCKELHIGSMILPNRKVLPVEECDISLPDFSEDRIIPGVLSFNFKAGGKLYECTAFTCHNSISDMRNEEIKGYNSKLVKTKYMINGDEAVGYGLFWYRHKGKGLEVPSYIIRPGIQIVEPQRKYVAPLSSPECKSVYLAGTKGTSLALLTSVKCDKFSLLDGFCVLVPTLQKHLEKNPSIKEELKNLNNICCGITKENISYSCERIKSLFIETPLSQQLQEDILNELRLLKYKSTDIEDEKSVKQCWAVRSSCVDEDLDKLPMLRNQTFLDCFSDEDVLKAVVLCWASVYSPEKVRHRRQRGLPIIVDMAVVVQYVIDSETAGVLSTCHPKTADPSAMVITANYGLGVSVVAAMVEPDTANITRTWNGKLSISHTAIGSKNSKVVISKMGITKIDNVNSKIFCLTSEQIYLIANVGLVLEKALGGHRTIEWAYYKDQLYLLNVKPIKFQYRWNKFDLIHETDTAIMSETDSVILTSSENIFQGVCSPLTQSLSVKYLDESLQRIYDGSDDFRTFVFKVLAVYNHQIGSNAFQIALRYVDKEITDELKIHELVTTGQSMVTEQLNQEALIRNRNSGWKDNIVDLLRTIKYCWNSSDYSEEATVLSQAIRMISYEEQTALEFFKVINRNLHLLKHIIHMHTLVSYTNIFYQKLLLNLMQDEKIDLSMEQFCEMQDTYNNSSIYNIPSKLELMAIVIRNKHLDEEFCKLNSSDVISFLEENCNQVIILLQNFMSKYGHRGVQECDFKSDPWENNTFAVIKILQLTVEKLQKENAMHNDNSQGNFTRSLSLRQKMNGRILKWLESKIENSFRSKEKTLSAASFTINKFRIAYRELAKKLTQEGKLPKAELIFYLTQGELKEIVKDRNLDLILKVKKRVELHSELKQTNLENLYTGEEILNKEISLNNEDENTAIDFCRIIGNTVETGHVLGRAYVLESIRQISHLKQGDILVTKYLDIGWIPLFPILSGIVTEYGNITTQGAIAVRKLKMPCIINAKEATKLLKTGDKILLIGTTGVVEKVENGNINI